MRTAHASGGHCDRRRFLEYGITAAATLPACLRSLGSAPTATNDPARPSPVQRPAPKVAIVSCKTYGPEVKAAMRRAFDLIGGIGGLVKDKTVTVKLNLTGTQFNPVFGRPVGESYMTHESTAMALVSLLQEAGVRRVRLVESTNRIEVLEETLVDVGWDVRELAKLATLDFENTRNLGKGKRYSHLKVPSGGHQFETFDLNHSYEDTDVMVSLCKLKNHLTAGVTLSMKNLFGITPNSLYGDQAVSERAVAGRGPLHSPREFPNLKLAGEKTGSPRKDAGYRIPRIVADLCAARPIHLAVIDGITSMAGGEGPWAPDCTLLKPGVMLVGFDPVATDAVGTAVMGYADPRAQQGTPPFRYGDNHLRLAEELGVGVADLARIEVRGLTIDQVQCVYPL